MKKESNRNLQPGRVDLGAKLLPIPQVRSFRVEASRDLERIAFLASLLTLGLALLVGYQEPPLIRGGVALLVALSLFYSLLAHEWEAGWLVYLAALNLTGAYVYFRIFVSPPPGIDVAVLAVVCLISYGLSEFFSGQRGEIYGRATLSYSLFLGLCAPAVAIARGKIDVENISLLSFAGTFFAFVCYHRNWKSAGYASGLLYNAVPWLLWMRRGWSLTDHPQFFLVPVGFSAILFAQTNRRDFSPQIVNIIRGFGSIMMALSTAVPMCFFRSFGAWLTLLLLSLAGIFVGIGMRVQTFVWMGFSFFLIDVSYQLWLAALEHTFAKWAIMVGVGLLLILVVALNEKMQIAAKARDYYRQVRKWE